MKLSVKWSVLLIEGLFLFFRSLKRSGVITISVHTIEAIYLAGLIIAGVLTLIFVFFGDIVEGISEAVPFSVPHLFSLLSHSFVRADTSLK